MKVIISGAMHQKLTKEQVAQVDAEAAKLAKRKTSHPAAQAGAVSFQLNVVGGVAYADVTGIAAEKPAAKKPAAKKAAPKAKKSAPKAAKKAKPAAKKTTTKANNGKGTTK